MKRVWIAQCLCPQRHAILALANEAHDAAEAERLIDKLKITIRALLTGGELNPWCGICHADEPNWRYEVGQTKWETMEAAAAALAESQGRNMETAAAFGELFGRRTMQ